MVELHRLKFNGSFHKLFLILLVLILGALIFIAGIYSSKLISLEESSKETSTVIFGVGFIRGIVIAFFVVMMTIILFRALEIKLELKIGKGKRKG